MIIEGQEEEGEEEEEEDLLVAGVSVRTSGLGHPAWWVYLGLVLWLTRVIRLEFGEPVAV